MPGSPTKTPCYGLHKATGRARVVLNGHTVYLGLYGTPESQAEYHRVIREWIENGRRFDPQGLPKLTAEERAQVAAFLERMRQPEPAAPVLSVTMLVDRYFTEHVEGYYVKNGRPTSEQNSILRATLPLQDIFGELPAAEFGPLKLKAVRDAMIGRGWSRKYVNDGVDRIRRMFKWAAENELVPGQVHTDLRTVAGLRRGRCAARETERVLPAADDAIDAVRPFVSRQVEALIDLQLLTGARPGELVTLRRCDLDVSGNCWAYRPEVHKTQHHGKERLIHIGPKAQEVIRRFFKPDLDAYLFSPADAERERHERMAQHRKTRRQPSQVARGKLARERGRRRAPADRYTVDSYRRAIERACCEAYPPPIELQPIRIEGKKSNGRKTTRVETDRELRARLGPDGWAKLLQWRRDHSWHPHQLRHNAATRLRKEFGIEVARIVLGHHSALVTEIYAEQDRSVAVDAMSRVG